MDSRWVLIDQMDFSRCCFSLEEEDGCWWN